MKQKTIYVCETCKYENKDALEMRHHEAEHLGLTLNELREYEILKRELSAACTEFVSHNTAKARATLQSTLDHLITFEKEHNLNNPASGPLNYF